MADEVVITTANAGVIVAQRPVDCDGKRGCAIESRLRRRRNPKYSDAMGGIESFDCVRCSGRVRSGQGSTETSARLALTTL